MLRHRTLAARETTDILMLDFAGCVGPVGADEALIQTLAQALQVAGAKRLEVDSRELGVLVAPAGEAGQSLGAVLYDNTAGGSGHVLELAMAGGDWLRDAREALVVSPAHHERCETACLDCLLTFDAQEAMGKGLLQRRRAFKALDVLLGNGSLPQPTRVPDSAPPTQAPPSTPSVPSDAEAARRRRFEARAALLAAEE